MSETKTLKVGDQAPDFILKDHEKKDIKLSELKGKKVLLSFHPLAWTSVCAKQMQSLEANKSKFDELNTIALGVNVDSIPSKNAWAKVLGITQTSLLSDFWPHGALAQKYRIFREKDGFSERANIIVDEDGKIAFIKIYDIPQLPDIGEIIEFLENKGD